LKQEEGKIMKRQIRIRRKIWWLISLIVLLSLIQSGTAVFAAAEDLSGPVLGGVEAEAGGTIYKQGELLVRFAEIQPGVQLPDGPKIVGPLRRSAIKSVISDFAVAGASVHKEYDHIVPGLTVVKLPEDVSVLDAFARFNQTANILYAEPNYKLRLFILPNDTRFSELWGMNNTGQSGGKADADIDAPEVWDIFTGTGSESVVVAVTDTGVDYNHEDLIANKWVNTAEKNGAPGVDDDDNGYIDDIYGYDFVNADADPMDDHMHGTHVAGIIGGVGNNNKGVAGVCWKASIMALKCFDASGSGSLGDAIEAIAYAVDNGAKVINASWGFSYETQALRDSIQAAADAGVILVAAAGNDGTNNDNVPYYPCNTDVNNVISVMATDHNDNRVNTWWSSNYGATTVDIGAPGHAIRSCYLGGNYVSISGTSMAAPHVAGACALMWAANPSLTYSQVKNVLLATVDTTLPGLCVSGGRLNLFNAISAAIPDMSPPTPNPAQWEVEPKATGLHTITMEAKVATDPCGVEYFFECVTDSNYNSQWQGNTLYQRVDFHPNTTYTFRVRYRDKSENQNVTGWSSEKSTTTASSSDDKSPFPDPSRWASEPHVLAGTKVGMEAKAASDESGVEYYFKETTGTGLIRNWGDNPSWIVMSGLLMGHTYKFQCKARDKSAAHNETAWSTLGSVTLTTPANILEVPFEYPTIRDALLAANNGDMVRIHPGTYIATDFEVRKNITVTGTNPQDPGVVAATVIDCAGQGVRGFELYGDTGSPNPSCSLRGLTIINATLWPIDGPDGVNPGDPGGNGGDVAGAGIYIEGNHIVENCVIRNCVLRGGRGGDGADGGGDPPTVVLGGGTGGNGGGAYGAGIYIASGNAIITGCTIDGCYAIAGNGGFGGNGSDLVEDDPNFPGGPGGNGGNAGAVYGAGICNMGGQQTFENCIIQNCAAYGGSAGDGGVGGAYADPLTCGDYGCGDGSGGHGGVPRQVVGAGFWSWDPGATFINCTFSNNKAYGGYGGYGGNAGIDNPLVLVQFPGGLGGLVEFSYADPQSPQGQIAPEAYSAFGGGVYAEFFTTISFSGCLFSGNITRGSVSGQGGYNGVAGQNWPHEVHRIQSFGAGIYSNFDTETTSTDCTIQGNRTIDEPNQFEYVPYLGDDGNDPYPRGDYNDLRPSPPYPPFELAIGHQYTGVGGGVCLGGDAYNTETHKFHNCNILGNFAPIGGGISGIRVETLHIYDCNIIDNSSEYGGGVIWSNSTADINGCTIRGNITAGVGDYSIGAGLYCLSSSATIKNCVLTENEAEGSGGALFFIGPYLSGGSHEISNCLITNNIAFLNGAGLSSNFGAEPIITNCTFVDNDVLDMELGSGGAISAYDGFVWLESSILWGNSAAYGPQIAVGDPREIINPITDVVVTYSDVQSGPDDVYVGGGGPWLWWLDGNIDEDPLFAATKDTEQTYFLKQIVSGQMEDSPCVDAGYGDASGLETLVGKPLTTRTDLVADSNTVDMGYHYESALVVPQYQLTIEVINQGYGTFGTVLPPWEPGTYSVDQGKVVELYAEPNVGWEVYEWTGTDYVPVYPTDPNYNAVTMDSDKKVTVEFGPAGTYKLVTHVIGNGTIEPAGLTIWQPGTVVPLTATPDNPSDVSRWTGTDDDFSSLLTNTVTMNAHKEVTVRFYEPRMLDVPGDYTNIQVAINEANDGDIVVIKPGIYDIRESSLPYEYEYLYISGKAITITSTNPDDPCCVAATIIYGVGFVIENVDRHTVINGLTIQSAQYWLYTIWITPTGPGNDGPGGHMGDTFGGGMQLLGDASPDVRNCRFVDCAVGGLSGGNGNSGVDSRGYGGQGGWPGGAYGGAVSVGENGSPIFKNCHFINCFARGGDGGNGGNDPAGHGGGWGDPEAPWWWEYGPGDNPLGHFEDYWRYTAFGGAAYCAADSYPDFVDCNFINNYVQGGSCGISGTNQSLQVIGWPYRHYRIDAFGGAVYAEAGSTPVFTGCEFINNQADVNGLPEHWDGDEAVSDDPYISYGGAIAFENGAAPTFNNCTFNNNLATIGGGMWANWSDPNISECYFVDNTAYHGGGVYFVGGMPEIAQSNFIENEALYDTSIAEPEPEDVLGEGGAINIFDADATIIDCNVFDNIAASSGGGIYISGSSKPLVKNCLVTSNFAIRDGGGVSVNWHSDVNIVNCTISDNAVTVGGTDTGFGGGLYCSYNSYINIINTIIWGNFGTKGAQLALSTGYEYDPRPSTANVKYSVVGPPKDVEVVIEPNEALGITVTNDADVLASTLIGPGIELIGQPQYTGANSAAGVFVGGLAAGIGIESGVILTSGNANLALPPNLNDAISADNNSPGDPDLTALLQAGDANAAEAVTYDAAVIEFTFSTRGGNLFFNFVFASDEYNEFTNSTYNDIFGFFLDGVNIALIPGTTTAVAINNVNGGNPLGAAATNPNLFNNNDPSDGGPFFDIQYDGFTGVFTAQAFQVGRGTHTIKLAIADVGDSDIDSAVFIQAGSFSDKPLYPDPIYVDEGCTLNEWDADAPDPNDPWDANTHNLRIDDDPLFVAGYYLSQVAAGQPVDSPCVDSGSADSNAPYIMLDTYTTRTDSFPDTYDPNHPDPNSVIVDMGYHYNPFTIPQYQLTFQAVGLTVIEPDIYDPNYDGFYNWYTTVTLRIDNNTYNPNYYQVWWTGTDDDSRSEPNNTVTMDGDKVVTAQLVKTKNDLTIEVVDGRNGRLYAQWLEGDVTYEIEDPCTSPVKFGRAVQLTAVPDEGYRVKKWSGTDDDTSRSNDNTVTMNSDRTVRVEFEPPTILSVPFDYSSIQQALDAAETGDTILIAPGVYTTSTGYLIYNKNVTISGTAPDDPCVVAATVINMEIGEEGYSVPRGFTFYNVGPEAVLNGITISGFIFRAYNGLDADELGEAGYNGMHGFGAGIICYNMASPTIKNCIIADCSVLGGSGGSGYDGSGSEQDDPNISGTDGGWPGKAYGGGLACLVDSSPTVINCTFDNCVAIGGNGGDGGNGGTTEDAYGNGGRGGGWYYGEDSRWYNVPWDRSSQGYERDGPVLNDFYDFYTEYTGRGGAVYVGEQCYPTFTHCTFTNNRTEGGTCGICGLDGFPPQDRVEPSLYWEIESFGGAVYCEESSSTTFVDCTFIGNTADVNYPSYNDDPYVGYGGAVAWETDANVVFEDCTFSDNLASIGGATYGEWAYSSMSDCNLADNTAYHGGGVFFIGGTPAIARCDFSGNQALYDTIVADPNLAINVYGEGGAIHCFDANITIVDCNIFNNDAAGSGGGIYITGSSTPLVKNCLITDNIAGRDGGGISANWHSDSNIVNCTIVGNRVTGSGFGAGYGGGLYCSYNSFVNIVNNIIWDNSGNIGAQGSQLAIATAFEYDPQPSTLNVTYSDVQGLTDPNAFGQRMNALDLVFCIDTTGSMADDIAAVEDAANEITDAIAEQIPDYRIAVVDYKDFNETPYGADDDYPYNTVLAFTTDTNEVVDALNSLTASGGGDTPESVYAAVMHCIDHNTLAAELGDELHGGDPESMGPGAWRPGNVMRVIILMGDAPPHDPEPFTNYTVNDIASAAGGFEPKRVVPVLIGQDPEAGDYFRALAAETGGTVVLAAGAEDVVGALMDAIDMISRIPDPVFIDANCVFNWDPNSYSWNPGSHNIDEDPCFVAGYYLSQVAAGQRLNSPCLNSGSANANAPYLMLNTYTTRTDSVSDAGIVDMGYHFSPFTVPQYHLTFEATGIIVLEPDIYDPGYDGLHNWYTTVTLRLGAYDSHSYQVWWTGTDDDSISGPNNTVTMDGDKVVTARLVKTKYDLTIEVDGGNGRLFAQWLEDSNTYEIEDPCTYAVKFGTVVQLTAEPDESYRVKRWIGTDDDTSRALTNTVTMNLDRTVRVEFELPATITVPGDYPTIWDAISEAEYGDTIVVDPGTYYGGYGAVALTVDKSVLVTSRTPDDPCCVAATIIDGYMGLNDYTNIGVVFTSDATNKTVFNGFTIQNCGGRWGTEDGEAGDRAVNHPDGYDGICGEGAAIYIMPGASPIIKNCVIRNNLVVGGDGGDGVGADNENNAGRGGWAGWARGGAVYCGVNSAPTFINCRILDNEARGGDGGNGGDYTEDGGLANYGGNWSINRGDNIDSNGLESEFVDGDLWEVWRWDYAEYYWDDLYGQPDITSYFGDYRWYSGYGGGVFCDIGCSATFEYCEIGGNRTYGGLSGQGGVMGTSGRQQEPLVPYEIPSYGAGVYCAAESDVMFTGCTFRDNIASEPNQTHRLDPYAGYGGGVCAEYSAAITFVDCNFIENEADSGGAIYVNDTNATIIDCNITVNTALRGGGFLGNSSSVNIFGCEITNNFTLTDVNDPNDDGIACSGAGLCFWSADVNVYDCEINGNQAVASGGGVYLHGGNTPSFVNCLIVNNLAGRDGGGVSVNWYAKPIIANCTFVSNASPGTFGETGNTGFGGGLYCSYESNCEVIDSIFWNNYALHGVEIVVHSGFEYDPRPSILTISYTDVKGGGSGIAVDTGCTLNWLAGNINKDPLFVTGLSGNYYLSEPDTGGMGQSARSPCVDVGSDLVSNVGLAIGPVDMRRYTTRTDGELDRGIVDMGYHYNSPLEPCSFCNFFDTDPNGNPQGFIDFRDFAMFALQWLKVGCSSDNDGCAGADLTIDTRVDNNDLFYFGSCWLVADTSGPVPNPSEWEVPPYEISSTTIRMEAREAIDGWGWDVQYCFERVPLGDPCSGWQNSPIWQDNGVIQGTVYGYRVKTRDELGNQSEWSEIAYAGEYDNTPPAPEPYINYTEPDVTTVTMTATETFDDSGVEYYFETDDVNYPGAHDSGWISDNNYVDVDLIPETTYAYRVQARDLSTNHNTTNWSDWVYVTTLPTPDVNAPQPNTMAWDPTGDPNGFPRMVYHGGGSFDYWIEMRSVQATDPSGVWYKFICVTNSDFNSGGEWDKEHPSYNGGVEWRNEDNVPEGVDPREYTVNIGQKNQQTEWVVIARDQYWNLTEPSETWLAWPPPGL
jgi:parallel beta-helix repeat protein